ncbi:hypothetical protein cypCar_00026070 [Cyprinus carpio]|nr:hypothetical protein cypCar_00026070 [Cyprinus carpio]
MEMDWRLERLEGRKNGDAVCPYPSCRGCEDVSLGLHTWRIHSVYLCATPPNLLRVHCERGFQGMVFTTLQPERLDKRANTASTASLVVFGSALAGGEACIPVSVMAMVMALQGFCHIPDWPVLL